MKNTLEKTSCPAAKACAACGGLGVAADCPQCAGRGMIITRTKREAELAHVPMFETCNVCRGHGQLPLHPDLAAELGLVDPPIRATPTPPVRERLA